MHRVFVLGEQEAVNSLLMPYPIEVTLKMLACFGSNIKLQSKENMSPYSRYIGDIGQELWIYSKNRELLSSDEVFTYIDISLLKCSASYHQRLALCTSNHTERANHYKSPRTNASLLHWQLIQRIK